MTETYLAYLWLIPLLVALYIAINAFVVLNRKIPSLHLSTTFSNVKIALIEKDLDDLTDVYVICHRITQPNADFRSAVINKLMQRVHYHFYVSKSSYEKEHDNRFFLKYFQACISIAETECTDDTDRDFSKLFSFASLPIEWNDYPYMFYLYKDTDGVDRLLSFRGTKKGVGLAPEYESLDIKSAATIARSIGIFTAQGTRFASQEEASNVLSFLEHKVKNCTAE